MARPALNALNALLVVIGVSTAVRAARATPSPATLRVEVSVCPGSELDPGEMRRNLSSELEADGLVRVLADDEIQPNAGKLSASVGCDPTMTTLVVLRTAGSAREVRRSLVLADADPSSRARVLALAAAEMVRSDWPELSADQPSAAFSDAPDAAEAKRERAEPAAARPGAVPPTPAAPAANGTRAEDTRPHNPPQSRATARDRRWAVSANARLRWFVDYASAAVGGDVGPDFGALRVRAELLLSSKSDALGSASLGSSALCVGYRVLESKLGPLSIAVYPTLSAGLTWMRGTSPSADVRVEPATGFYGDVRLLGEARLTDSALSPTLAAEIGRATGFVARSADRVLGASGGFFLGASAGGRY